MDPTNKSTACNCDGCAAIMFIATKEHDFAYFKMGIPLIVIAAISQEKRFQRFRLVGSLGDWSYSTYLCHAIVLSIAYRATLVWQWDPYFSLGAACLAIVLISWLSFTIVERNISLLIKQKLQTSRVLGFRPT